MKATRTKKVSLKDKMPENWSDPAGWDVYYKANQIDLEEIHDYQIRDSLRYYPACSGKKVWVSGCGLELTPWLLSYLNCEVLATDISGVAIDFQRQLITESPFGRLKNLSSLIDELNVETKLNFIQPKIRVEDFSLVSPNETFDVILNTKAIQGLPEDKINSTARIFFDATTPGGIIIVSTMNVQGNLRNTIEDAFSSAGYFIPNMAAERWYRNKLESTGILYVMVLGRPVIPQWGQYEDNGGKEQEEKDRELLRSFAQEYQERLKLNYEEDKKNYVPGRDKLAYIIYNTG